MTRISYEQLKNIVVSHCQNVSVQSLQHRVQQIAERHLPSHNDLLPLRAIHDCEQPHQLLILLEKWALLSPTKTKILEHFCNDFQGGQSISVFDVLDTYAQYNTRGETCPCSSLPSLSQQNLHLIDGCLTGRFTNKLDQPEIPVHYARIVDFLSDELGRRWLDVGRQLPGLRNFVRNLSEDHTLDSKNKIVSMLEELYSKNGPNTVPVLMEALAACRLNRQRDRVQELLPQPASNVLLSSSNCFGTSSYT